MLIYTLGDTVTIVVNSAKFVMAGIHLVKEEPKKFYGYY